MKNKELLKWYERGFDNELKGEFVQGLESLRLCEKAYLLGAVHAIVGDEVPSVDELSDKEILQMIKNHDKK